MPTAEGRPVSVLIVYFHKHEEDFAGEVKSELSKPERNRELSTFLLDLPPPPNDLKRFQETVVSTDKLIIIVNREVLKTSWLDYVCVHSKNPRLFPILFNLEKKDIPADYLFLERLSFNQRYLQFTDESTEQEKTSNWTTLESALTEQEKRNEQIQCDKASVGLAWSYFYGYLKLILPGLKARVKSSIYHNQHREKKMIAKLFIIIPVSCRCPQQMKLADQNIVFDDKIDFSANRAGNENRNYAHVVQKITNPRKLEEVYYCMCEFATPMMALYEMCDEKVASFDEEKKYIEMLSFRNHLMYILRHPKHAAFGDRAELIIWDDNQTEESLSELLCRKIKSNLEIEDLLDDTIVSSP